MLIRENRLVTINSKNKVQTVLLSLNQDSVNNVYTINRITSQYGGKEVIQPILTIDKGKVKRTAAEQANLQYNSLLQNYLDKGYVKLSLITSKTFKEITEDEIKEYFNTNGVSDQAGIPKPMLAKLSDQCSPDIFETDWFVSCKLDGVRCLLYYKDNQVHSASRGGGNYDVATTHIRTNPKIIEFFKANPNIILDGELYKHDSNYPLQKISGLARLQEWNEECNVLEYWVYDYVSKDSFETRWKSLQSWEQFFKDTPIKILPQKKMSGYLNIKKEHDKYVKDGFEGLCARNPNKEYGVNKRSALYLIKMKDRKDAEFEIVGIKEGLRPEDMCFVLKTKDGKEFAAKPIGTVESRLNFLAHKEDYIGKMATCTYFSLSSDGIPTQPVFKHIRPQGE